jgi:hypothetical protein
VPGKFLSERMISFPMKRMVLFAFVSIIAEQIVARKKHICKVFSDSKKNMAMQVIVVA